MALEVGETLRPALPLDTEPREGEARPRRRPRAWRDAAGSVRSRILIPYAVLLALAALLPLLVFNHLSVVALEDQVRSDLGQEMQELDRLLLDGRDPETGQRFASLEALFDVYFARNVPSRGEAFLSFVDGELYRSSTLTRFPLDRLPSEAFSDWEELASRSPGDEEHATGRIQTTLGDAYFRTARIHFQEDVGAFVVTILPSARREEIGNFVAYGGVATLGFLLIASAASWFIAGRVLRPVRQLTEVARSISQSDLSERIEVRATGEAAEMAGSFNAMLDRLEAVFQSQREFVQDASHGLRDPITIIRGYVELWDDEPAQRRRMGTLVLDELDRMGRIVDDLRLLAESEQPGFLRAEWVDVDQFTREVFSKASALASRRWILDPVGDGTFFVDRHRLTEAVMNLAHNAVHYTTESDTVALGTSLSNGEIRIWVRDTGSGIPASDQAVIFERFRRGAGARVGGSGLGLAIVKAVAESHEGRVELESRPGEGSTFTIVMPRQSRGGPVGGQNSDR